MTAGSMSKAKARRPRPRVAQVMTRAHSAAMPWNVGEATRQAGQPRRPPRTVLWLLDVSGPLEQLDDLRLRFDHRALGRLLPGQRRRQRVLDHLLRLDPLLQRWHEHGPRLPGNDRVHRLDHLMVLLLDLR